MSVIGIIDDRTSREFFQELPHLRQTLRRVLANRAFDAKPVVSHIVERLQEISTLIRKSNIEPPPETNNTMERIRQDIHKFNRLRRQAEQTAKTAKVSQPLMTSREILASPEVVEAQLKAIRERLHDSDPNKVLAQLQAMESSVQNTRDSKLLADFRALQADVARNVNPGENDWEMEYREMQNSLPDFGYYTTENGHAAARKNRKAR